MGKRAGDSARRCQNRIGLAGLIAGRRVKRENFDIDAVSDDDIALKCTGGHRSDRHHPDQIARSVAENVDLINRIIAKFESAHYGQRTDAIVARRDNCMPAARRWPPGIESVEPDGADGSASAQPTENTGIAAGLAAHKHPAAVVLDAPGRGDLPGRAIDDECAIVDVDASAVRRICGGAEVAFDYQPSARHHHAAPGAGADKARQVPG